MSSPHNKLPFSRALANNTTQFDDVTTNQSTLLCSPKGGSKGIEKMVSPGRVRTTKEYEEQMAELKKENFNLKLRIYFIEERQEQMKGLKDVDDLFKKNVELSCELETLKKDLSDKEELLVQSAKALEILQNQHKKQVEEIKLSSTRDRMYLEDHITNLQKVLREKEQTINQFDNSSAVYTFGHNKGTDQIKEIDDLKLELNNVTIKVVQLEGDLQEEKRRYFTLQCELQQAHHESAQLQNQVLILETDVEKREARLQQAYIDLERKTEQLNRIAKREKDSASSMDESKHNVSGKDGKVEHVERPQSRSPCDNRRMGPESTSNNRNADIEQKGTTVERKPKSRSSSGNRRSSVDSSGNSRDVSQSKARTRRDDKGLTKQLQEANSKLFELEEHTQTMEAKLHEAESTSSTKDKDIIKLQEEYRKACFTIQALLKKSKGSEKEVTFLKTEIEKKDIQIQEMALPYKLFPTPDNSESGDINIEDFRKQLHLAEEKVNELTHMHSIATSEMETQIQNLKSSLNEKEVKLNELEEDTQARLVLEYRIAELESKLQDMQQRNKYEMTEGKLNCAAEGKLEEELESKKKEVEHLNSELRKRTFNLQELVNKELWDKNREIEKLNKQNERRQMEIMQLKQQISSGDAQVSYSSEKLKESASLNNLMRGVQLLNFEEVKENCSPLLFTSDDRKVLKEQLARCLEEKKILTKKVEELEDHLQNMPERDSDSCLLHTLKSDLIHARQDVEVAEKGRKDVVVACSLLTNRLQELADFLDSLLPSLGAKKRRVVQQAVERSRELSRSFSAAAEDVNSWEHLQPSLHVPLLPDFSNVDFWSGDDVTDLTLEEEANDEVDTITQLRTEVQLLKDQLKQKDSELSRIDNQSLPSFQSNLWSLATNDFQSINSENNGLAKLVSMFESLETSGIVGSNVNDARDNNGNFDSFVPGKNLVLLRNETKSSNIGEIVINSRKVSSKEERANQNIGSESEAWSEPDRSVSLARIGLTDDTSTQQYVNDDSSDTTDNGQKTLTGNRKLKYDNGELRRLQSKIQSLEETNEALRGELNILYQLAPPAFSSREDKSTSIEGISIGVSVPTCLLDEIRNQREKLESSLFYNDNIRKQLEAIFALLKGNEEEISYIQQIKDLKDELTKVKAQCNELEGQCKALEVQCSDLEVALHSERSVCNQKDEQCSEMGKDITALREEQAIWKEKVDLLQSKIEQLESELKLKCDEVSEKQSALIDFKKCVQEESVECEKRIKEVEVKLLEERKSWAQAEDVFKIKMKSLQSECDDLKGQLYKFTEERREISEQLQKYKVEEEHNKQQLHDINSILDRYKTMEERARLTAEEWKAKCVTCQENVEQTRASLKEAECKITEMEKLNSELELGLRNQVQVVSKQCSQAEFMVKDLEIKHKLREAEWRDRVSEVKQVQSERAAEWRRQLDAATLTTSEVVLERTRLANDKLRLQQEIRRRDTSTLERVKSELERRVTELEVANSELESRLALKDTKVPSDSETEEQDQVLNFASTKRLKWPSTSTSPPLSPSSKFLSSHMPLSSHYATQRSNDISSDYMSDQDNGQTCSVFWPQRSPVSASPDLGIESDQGRFSSLETPLSHTVSIKTNEGVGELVKLQEENVFLKNHLMRTRRALENTLSQLTAANHKKRQVERAICRQIGKTHIILQKARVNLETDFDPC